jgi:hypothetical protein
MMRGLRFPGQVSVVLVVGVILLGYPLWRMGSPQIAAAVATGALMATVNALVGYRLLAQAQGKSYTTFLKVVLGGTGIRMAVLLAGLVLLIKVAGMDPLALTVSLLGFYVVFLILEVLCIQRNVLPPNQG